MQRSLWFVVGCAALVMGVACGEDDEGSEPPPGVSPSTAVETRSGVDSPGLQPTLLVSPDARACPAAIADVLSQEACDFVLLLEELMSRGDYKTVAARARGARVECDGPEPPLGPKFPLCIGAEKGEARTGYYISRLQSESGTVSRESLIAMLRRWVTVDSGGLPIRAVTVGCPLVGGVADCGERFVVTLLGANDEFLLRFGVERAVLGGLEIVETIGGLTPLNMEMVEGGDDDLPVLFSVPGVPAGTRYFAVE